MAVPSPYKFAGPERHIRVAPPIRPLNSVWQGYEARLRREVLHPLHRHAAARLRRAGTEHVRLREAILGIQWPDAKVAGPARAAALAAARRTKAHHTRRFESIMGAALGVKVGPMLPDTEEVMRHFLRANVDLIKTIPKRHLDSLYRGLGRLAETNAFDRSKVEALLSQSFGSSGYNLRRLTRDQTSKLSSQLDRVRQQAVGVEQYRWLTAADERVRDEHQANSGRVFSWKAAPSTGHPADAVQCRCVAEPVIPLAPRSTAPKPSRSETAIPPVAKAPPKPDYRAADADPEAVRKALLAKAARARTGPLIARLERQRDELTDRLSGMKRQLDELREEYRDLVLLSRRGGRPRTAAEDRRFSNIRDEWERIQAAHLAVVRRWLEVERRLGIVKVREARDLREEFILRPKGAKRTWNMPSVVLEQVRPPQGRRVAEAFVEQLSEEVGRLYHRAPSFSGRELRVAFRGQRAGAKPLGPGDRQSVSDPVPVGARIELDRHGRPQVKKRRDDGESEAAIRHDQMGIAIHEFTHTAEYADEAWLANSVDELYRRTRGEATVKLKDYTGVNYRVWERARVDLFGAGGRATAPTGKARMWAYAGSDRSYLERNPRWNMVPNPWKEGEWYRSTEMLTMGVEYRWGDPARLAREDPDLFRWALRTIRRGPVTGGQ